VVCAAAEAIMTVPKKAMPSVAANEEKSRFILSVIPSREDKGRLRAALCRDDCAGRG